MTDAQLHNMTVKELQALKDAVDSAIRKAIAQSRVQALPQGAAAPPTLIDLERERDAWKARR